MDLSGYIKNASQQQSTKRTQNSEKVRNSVQLGSGRKSNYGYKGSGRPTKEGYEIGENNSKFFNE